MESPAQLLARKTLLINNVKGRLPAAIKQAQYLPRFTLGVITFGLLGELFVSSVRFTSFFSSVDFYLSFPFRTGDEVLLAGFCFLGDFCFLIG